MSDALKSLYNASCDIYRSITTGGAKRPEDTLVVSGVRGVLRPVMTLTKLYNEGNIGREFDWWCESTTDIRINDYIIINGRKYGVMGVQLFEDLDGGVETHLQCRVNLQK